MTNIATDLASNKAEIVPNAETDNGPIDLSWLWASLFGPVFFWVNGFVALGFFFLALNIVVIGSYIATYTAYKAWRKRALESAEKLNVVNKAYQNRAQAVA